MAAEIKLSKGEYVFREGETASYAYMLKEGSVSIVKSGVDGLVKLTEAQAGMIFGEMALIDGNPRSAGAVASTEVVLTEVDRTYFLTYLAANPNVAFDIMRRLSSQVRNSNKDTADGKTTDNTAGNSSEKETSEFNNYLDEITLGTSDSIDDPDEIYVAGPRKPLLYSSFALLFLLMKAVFQYRSLNWRLKILW